MKIRSAMLWSVASLLTFPFLALDLEAQAVSPAPSPITRFDPPVTPGPAATTASIVAEIEKMVQAGADTAVIKAYIQNWTTRFSVSADEILHLHDIGLPTDVLTTLIQRSAELQ